MQNGCALALFFLLAAVPSIAQPVSVDPGNFCRAESDRYFSGVVGNGGFGRFDHTREPTPMDKQVVIRLNRDTIYSAAVLDLEASPATIRLPEAGDRFVSLQVINQNHFVHGVHYAPATVTLEQDDVGTRYAVVAVRTLVNPEEPDDVARANALQDSIRIEQSSAGRFEIPEWDQASQDRIRAALLELATTLPESTRMYGAQGEVDPVRHLIGCALGWGANPASEALYLNIVPSSNDGETVHSLTVGDVPVDGFWSISVYNEDGYFEPNDLDAYSLNNITAARNDDGSITVQFGACDAGTLNCLPTPPGWNYMVRLYRPSAAILDGSWSFPPAEPMQ